MRTAFGGAMPWQAGRFGRAYGRASRGPLADGHCCWPAAGLEGLNLGEFASVPALASIFIASGCRGLMAGQERGGSELVATVAAPIAVELSFFRSLTSRER